MEQLSIYGEKIKTLNEKYDTIYDELNKLKDKVHSVEKSITDVNSNVTQKMIQLETKFDMYSKFTGEKIDSLISEIREENTKSNKKMDSFIEKTYPLIMKEEKKEIQQEIKPPPTPTPQDSFKEWLFTFGKKLLEYGIMGGIFYAVIKGQS